MSAQGDVTAKRTLWSRAEEMARKAPPERNRYVDFLRAFSILAVVIGHWLVAAPYIENGAVQGGHLLGILPWTQWLTWGFQVMPIFFLVGGFSHALSWSANQRKDGSYAGWFTGRLRRLINPVLPLFLIWTLFALFGTAMGVERKIVELAAQLALIPVWFLAVYLMVSAVVPLTHGAWKRFGMASFWGLVAGAILIDVATFSYQIPYVNFVNFAFIWLAVHQLGYAWSEGYFSNPMKALFWGLGGLTVLGLLVGFGPYPVAMIGVPGEPVSNSMPPTIALLALGMAQTGIALALEPAARRMLGSLKIWTAVVLVNGMIMTTYLWHLTAFVFVMVVAWLLGGIGLEVAPGSGAWWLARPIWFILYIVALLPLIMIFAKYEQAGANGAAERDDLPHWRLIVGLLFVCAGLAATAAISIASPLGVTGVRLWVVAMPFIGAAFIGFGPAHKLAKRLR
ncbi:acyltransferase family protein [Parasphingorhabdus litoris]|uniref:Acyltransferase family protein n=1 Tax=Parasphingorhabdus litoris TaxID=394733 RepID=A0ABN1ASN1_9SPHN|nr:acyltransferase [Parasphingorhabdus litoris]